MGVLDDARAAIQEDLINDLFLPQDDDGEPVPNWRRVRKTGGVLNHLDELTGSVDEIHEFAAVTGRGTARIVEEMIGQIPTGDLVLITVINELVKGDRVERILDDEPFEVVECEIPELNGTPVAYVYTLRRQTD